MTMRIKKKGPDITTIKSDLDNTIVALAYAITALNDLTFALNNMTERLANAEEEIRILRIANGSQT